MSGELMELGVTSAGQFACPRQYVMGSLVMQTVHSESTNSAYQVVLSGASWWVVEAAKKLEALKRLPGGWDSYGGLPLRRDARELTVNVLNRLSRNHLPVPAVVLGSGGTVHLEWRSKGKELEVELGGGNTIGYVKVGPHGEMEEGESPKNDLDLLNRMTQWLMKG